MIKIISGLILGFAGIIFWLGTMIADPYTAWGLGYEEIRPSVAWIGINLAFLAIASHLSAGAVIFSVPRYRKGKWAMFGFAVLLFLLGTAIARLIWVRFIVLG